MRSEPGYSRPRLKTPAGSNDFFSCAMDAVERRGERREHAGRPCCARRNSVAWPPAGAPPRALRAAGCVLMQPALRAVPFDQRARRRGRAPARSAARQPPQRARRASSAARALTKNSSVWSRSPLQNGAASAASISSPPSRSAALLRPRPRRRAGAAIRLPSHHALASSGSGWPPHSLRRAQRAGLVDREAQRRRRRRDRQHLQRDLEDHARACPASRPAGARRRSRRRSSSPGRRRSAPRRGRSAASRRARGRAPSRRSRAPGPTGRRRPCRRPCAPAPKCGGSNGRHWPCVASSASSSASERAAARRHDQLGRLVARRCRASARVSSDSPCGASP